MNDRFEVDTDNFRVDLLDGAAELVFGAPGSMLFTDARGHRELAKVWSRLDAHDGIRAIVCVVRVGVFAPAVRSTL
ncbi:hypothetical protein [Caballeronia sordidicola]|uniref:hypothetical protein n=1 Tax=Caballeronia sordidicola TaxID=196367 RepID=UPI00068DB8E7|nr:hypothetical protein [Caballeronia sordidicola]